LPELPPWAIKVFTSSIPGVVVPLLPTDRRVLRLTIHISCKGTVASFCVVASNSLNVLDVCNSWLPTLTSYRLAICSALSKAVEIISLRRHAFNYSEICLEGKDTPTLFQPTSSLSEAEALVFSAIQALGQSCLLLLACHSSSPGCVLARLWADRPTRGDPNAEALPSKSLAAKAFSAFLTEVWNKELTSSPNGATTRLFFPEVTSAALLLRHRSNAVTFQLLSGHCALNSHQHRFGFSASPACACGHSFESISHFLFDCPNFSQLRQSLFLTTSANDLRWPPTLSTFPTCIPLWHALVVFITKSKRLVLKQA
jgi:hypothetical protein